jgi:hypothetical protein
MRIQIFLINLVITVVLIPIHLNAQEDNPVKNTLAKGIYQVVKINKIKNVYVIHVFKDNEEFDIVSPKREKPTSGLKIKKGRLYELTLIPYFENTDYSRFRVTAVEIEGTLIPLEPQSNYNIFFTNEVVGLYYVKR